MLSALLRRLSNARSLAAPRRRRGTRGFRPHVEVLEERKVLAVSQIEFDRPAAIITEGDIGSFTVRRTSGFEDDITVFWTVNKNKADTAIKGQDYALATTRALHFAAAPAGTTVQEDHIDLRTFDDTLDEADDARIFSVTLTKITSKNNRNATAQFANPTAVVFIEDDDPPPGVSLVLSGQDRTTVAEGSTQRFAVKLSEKSNKTVTVNYSVDPTSATAGYGTDFTVDKLARTGTLTFKPGETSKRLTVKVAYDNVVEPDETFKVELSGGTNVGLIVPATKLLTIKDDTKLFVSLRGTSMPTNAEHVPRHLTLNAAANLKIILLVDVERDVSFLYATADGTATTADNDYVEKHSQVVFGSGSKKLSETSLTVSVPPYKPSDALSEKFTVSLTSDTDPAFVGQKKVTVNLTRPRDEAALPLAALTWPGANGIGTSFAIQEGAVLNKLALDVVVAKRSYAVDVAVRFGASFDSGAPPATAVAGVNFDVTGFDSFSSGIGLMHFAAGETRKTFTIFSRNTGLTLQQAVRFFVGTQAGGGYRTLNPTLNSILVNILGTAPVP